MAQARRGVRYAGARAPGDAERLPSEPFEPFLFVFLYKYTDGFESTVSMTLFIQKTFQNMKDVWMTGSRSLPVKFPQKNFTLYL